MAYMSQEKKARIAAALKVALKGTGLKYSLSVHHHSTIVMKIAEGDFNFAADHKPTQYGPTDYISKVDIHKGYNINPRWYHEHFIGRSLEVLTKIITCLNDGNHNRSDSMTDYFDVGWYVDVTIGRWDKPYVLKAPAAQEIEKVAA